MTKFNKIREKKVQEINDSGQGYYLSLLDAFDAAIALELPVKFAEWKRIEQIKPDHHGLYNIASFWFETEKQLYQYWVDNVYKPE